MSNHESHGQEGTDLDERDVRALEQYLTVLPDTGRARGAADLYLVVSQSGKEYLVDTREGRCTCPDHEHRGVRCKHQHRVAFATGARPVPDGADDVDPQLGEHVDGSPRAVATDGGRLEWDDTPDYTEHVEPREQGGETYVRCEGWAVAGSCSFLSAVGRSSLTPTAVRTAPTGSPWSVNLVALCGFNKDPLKRCASIGCLLQPFYEYLASVWLATIQQTGSNQRTSPIFRRVTTKREHRICHVVTC
jgi:hypothetical protein